MTNSDHTSTMETLYKHDLAACEIYKEVLEHIDDASIRQKIREFLNDHEDHVRNLAATLKELTGEDPGTNRDLKGVLLSGYATVRSMTGQEGALKALETAEEIVLKAYEEASKEPLDAKLTDLVRKNLEDERKHNEYVKGVLMAKAS